MSLTKLLLEFNPNQLRIGDETPHDKIRRSMEKVPKPRSDRYHKMSKQDVLDILSDDSPEVHNAIESVVAETDLDIYQISFSVDGRDVLELAHQQLGDEVIDWDIAEKLYNEPADKDTLWDFIYDYVGSDVQEALYFIKDDYERQIIDVFLVDIIQERGDGYLNDLWDAVNDAETINGEDCMKLWRAIRVDLTAEYPLSRQGGLGVYWSYEEAGAEAYGAGGVQGEDIIVEAYVPLGSIDWDTTLYKTFWDLNHEMEVETYEGQEIFINKIFVEDRDIIRNVENKAQLIVKTYFKKKLEKGDDYDMIKLRDKVEQWLMEKNKINEKFTITFDNYYKTST